MAKARKILKRAKSIKSIRTVTKTMEMVATARFRKSHQRVVATKPFVDRLADVVSGMCGGGLDDISHPLLRAKSEVKRTAMLVITSNRGLAGAFNSSVLRTAVERVKQLHEAGEDVELHVVGKRGLQFMRFRKLAVTKAYTQFDKTITFEQASEVADTFMDLLVTGKINNLEVAYMQFISSGKQKPVVAKVLPLTELTTGVQQFAPGAGAAAANYELIPSGQEILQVLLPLSVRMKIYQCFLDSAVSEQMMRIAAMRSATDAADDMVHDLTILYNRSRQGQITTELAEIMGGRVGLEE